MWADMSDITLGSVVKAERVVFERLDGIPDKRKSVSWFMSLTQETIRDSTGQMCRNMLQVEFLFF